MQVACLKEDSWLIILHLPGVPLSTIGMVAYGLVMLLSLQQTRKSLLSTFSEIDIRLIRLGTTTSMATASAYFLYLLSTKLAGSSCLYCLTSVFLSFSLFFVTLKVSFKSYWFYYILSSVFLYAALTRIFLN